MKDHPILFSGEMVRAILAGKKEQTRRIIKEIKSPLWVVEEVRPDLGYSASMGNIWAGFRFNENPQGSLSYFKCLFGKPGDLLWVREKWAFVKGEPTNINSEKATVYYEADRKYKVVGCQSSAQNDGKWIRWRPSIHMPKIFSRISLEIIDIQVERLQDISDEDVKAEGVEMPHNELFPMINAEDKLKAEFQRLWNSVNGAGVWGSNPYVWKIIFKRIKE